METHLCSKYFVQDCRIFDDVTENYLKDEPKGELIEEGDPLPSASYCMKSRLCKKLEKLTI